MGPALNIFAIYTLEDIAVMHDVVKRLKSSGRDANLSIWKDDAIKQGQLWKPEIESRLHKADIFLLFLSNRFMHSEFVKQLEFKTVIDRYKEGKSKVIPIILDECPWDIDFEADEYTFSFKELQVLPEQGKPIKNWDAREDAYKNILAGLESEIPALTTKVPENKPKIEEQTALSFDAAKEAEEAERRKEEIKSKRIAQEKRVREEAERQKRTEEKQRLQEEAEAKRRIEEQRQKESESSELEDRKRLAEEAERKRQAAEAQRIEEENRQEATFAATEIDEELQQEKGSSSKKRILIGAGIALLAIVAIWNLSKSSEESIEPSLNTKTTEIDDSVPIEKIEVVEPVAEKESLPELVIGDRYQEGIVFAIDSNSKNGQIVHIDDAGPMTWESAMQIHEKLGEGWRLPTLDELRVLRKTVGQGATNTAEFSNGLYWSATDYDQHQARLLRFRDGNRSYHYNKVAEHRKYRVRAIRDFSRD